MVLLAVLAMAATAAPSPPRAVTAERQAIAMVRILPGAPLRFAEIEKASPEMLRTTQVRAPDGSMEPARLVEFH